MGARQKGKKLWQGAIVPYEINPDLGNIVSIEDAIKTFEQQTNVRFVRRISEDDYVRFSKQTAGNPHSKVGRQGGRQFLDASLNDVGSLMHEMGHAVALMHEHQREDRDDFLIFHADRVTKDRDQYKKRDTVARTEKYDFKSLMHYNAGDASNPYFESRTGVPIVSQIGSHGSLTITDKEFLEYLYPAAPVIRRTDGEGGAGPVRQTSAIVVKKVSSSGVVTGTLANAVQNGSGNYQLVLWSIRDNGVVLRLPDPAGATGGKASKVQMVPVGRLFVSAMANADGELLLISHSNSFARLKDSAGQAGKVKGLHLVTLTDSRVLTVCVSAAGRLLNIVWEIQPDGSITRLFDSGSDGPRAKNVASVLYREDGTSQIVATVYANNSSKLVLSTWRIAGTSIDFVADSGNRMGVGDLAYLVNTATGHLVIVCRDGNKRLLLIPFSAADDGTDIARVSGGSARAGKVREVFPVERPYGLLTAVISEAGHVLLIKWAIKTDGAVARLGESGTQAGRGSRISATALPFADQATVCSVVRNARGDLLPIIWDDADGPGELSVA